MTQVACLYPARKGIGVECGEDLSVFSVMSRFLSAKTSPFGLGANQGLTNFSGTNSNAASQLTLIHKIMLSYFARVYYL
ncbi:hypothetical protein ACET3Z_031166 [Daucus carota]